MIGALQLLIVAELCVLGVGVVRRMEVSYETYLEASRAQLAVLEQQTFAQERSSGVAIVGAVTAPPQESTAAGGAPALRARDVATIIAEDTGDIDLAVEMMAGDSAEGHPAEEGAESAAGEDDEEVDALIRKGVAALIAGDMRLSILSLEQAAALAPNHPAMLYYYGMAYDRLLNPNKARDYYKRLFQMREQAGRYYERAARRLTYGVEQPSALRGKLAFGPHRVQYSYDMEQGEQVKLLLPILLAPGEEIRADEVNLRVEFFDLVNGNKVDFAREEPKASWVNEVQNWESGEEDLVVTYAVPPQETGQPSLGSDVKYYGFVAKLYYRGEPMDCISSPSALILHEQQLNNRRRGWDASGLLPDDGLDPYSEQAVPYSEAYDETAEEIYP